MTLHEKSGSTVYLFFLFIDLFFIIITIAIRIAFVIIIIIIGFRVKSNGFILFTWVLLLTLFRMGWMRGGGGQKGKPSPPTSFFSVTSAKVGIRPQNFLAFSFNPYATMV